MLKQQMLIEKTNYEPHLNIELLTGSFIENKFKNICAQIICDAYVNESLIIEYLRVSNIKYLFAKIIRIHLKFFLIYFYSFKQKK